MTHPFLAASTWQEASGGRFGGVVDERWLQGKGAFGGLINAGIVRAMQAVIADPRRRLRTFHVHFCAPAKPGPFECVVVVERAGAGVTTVSARVLQGDGVVSAALATFAFARNNADAALVFAEAPPPSLPSLDDTPPTQRDASVLPAFTQFFEYRFCLGAIPFSGAEHALIGGYLAFAEPLDVVDHAAVVALIDAYPPALLPKLSSLRGSSSVDMSVDLHVDTAAITGRHFIVRQSSRAGDGGFTDERGELWTLDGTLVATSRQLVAVL